jgi:hypothetical protein
MRYPGFIGPSYTLTSLPAGVERCVNLYPQIDESGNGKNRAVLIGTPGLSLFSTLGDAGPVRGIITCYGVATGGLPRVFVVSGPTAGTQTLYELNSAGTPTSRGAVSTSGPNAHVRFAYNETELMIAVLGVKPWRFKFSDNTLVQITGAPAAMYPLVFLDGYFIGASTVDGERDRIYISALKDGNTWDALDFGEADATPDIITDMVAVNKELYLMGQISGQVFFNSGNVDFPFEPIAGRVLPVGCGSAFGLQEIEGTLVWMSHEERGRGVFYRADGVSPRRISTHAVEEAVRGYANLHITTAWSYQESGHLFYVAYFPTANRTWVYDLTTNAWHEWMFLNGASEEAALANCHTFSFWEASPFRGKHLVGSRSNGLVYEMSPSVYQDVGSTIRRIRRAPHLHNEQKRLFFHAMQVDLEAGLAAATGLAIAGGGTGYTANDVLTVVGGVGEPLKINVLTVAAGVIATVSVNTEGSYISSPSNPVSVTGGTGTGATFNLTLATQRLSLRWSNDGGKTFSTAAVANAGGSGNFKGRARWLRLGSARDRVFEVSSDAPVRQVWTDAFLEAESGRY